MALVMALLNMHDIWKVSEKQFHKICIGWLGFPKDFSVTSPDSSKKTRIGGGALANSTAKVAMKSP